MVYRLPGLACLALMLASPQMAFSQSWPDLSKPAAAVGGGAKDAALVISIERYAHLPPIAGAEANGRAWYLHLTKTMQVPVSRVTWLSNRDAAKENIEDAAKKVATWVKPGGTLWLVFIGHGAPSPGGDGVLVGSDAQQSARMLYARSVPQKALRGLLEAGKQARTVMVVDSCFSGRSRAGAALAEGLQPTLAAKYSRLSGRTVVLSAGTSDQFAGPLPGASRPAFSYLVLGALRGWGDADRNGRVTAAEAVGYAGGVLRTLVKGRTQTPRVFGSKSAALARPSGRAEKGPDLAAIGAKASRPTGTFGQGLGKVNALPTLRRLDTALPETSLGSVDVSLLKLLQTAKRADKSKTVPYESVAAKWDTLARYKGAGALLNEATRRREEWKRFNKAVCERRSRLAKVRKRHAADKAKLSELLALDDDVLPRARKKTYREEFRTAYARWESALAAKRDARANCVQRKAPKTPARVPPAASAWTRDVKTFNVRVRNGYRFHRVLASGQSANRCKMTMEVYFDSPSTSYIRLQAKVKFKSGAWMRTSGFNNTASGARKYTHHWDTTKDGCWAKKAQKAAYLWVTSCIKKGCTPAEAGR